MIVAQAEILLIKDDRVLIKYRRSSSCGGCSEKAKCATGQTQQALPESNQSVWIEHSSSLSLVIGEWIEVGIEEHHFLRGVFLIYFVPILGLVIGALLGDVLQFGDFGTSVFSGGGFLLSLLMVRYLTRFSAYSRYRVRCLRSLGVPICGDFVTNRPLKDSD
jgi:sigma-E factor negative regulatory protein RseC